MKKRVLNPDGTWSYFVPEKRTEAQIKNETSESISTKEMEDDKDKPVTQRPIEKLTLNELKELAVAEGIDFAKNATKARLKELIINKRVHQKNAVVSSLNAEVKADAKAVAKDEAERKRMDDLGL